MSPLSWWRREWGVCLCEFTVMKSPPLQSMSTLSYSTVITSLGSAMKKAAQLSWGRSAVKVNWPSTATMSRQPDDTRTRTETATVTVESYLLSILSFYSYLFIIYSVFYIFLLISLHCDDCTLTFFWLLCYLKEHYVDLINLSVFMTE